jgi:hypothetical protein
MRRRHLAVVLVVGATIAIPTAAAGAVTTPLDGRWTSTITQAQLRRANADPKLVPKLWGTWTARYANGRVEFHNLRSGSGARGTFSIQGNVVRIVFASGIGVKPPNNISVCTWSIYRDRLTFKTIPGRPSQLCDAGVWTRARE